MSKFVPLLLEPAVTIHPWKGTCTINILKYYYCCISPEGGNHQVPNWDMYLMAISIEGGRALHCTTVTAHACSSISYSTEYYE